MEQTGKQSHFMAALQNGQVVCVPDDNYRNPLRPTKRLLQSCGGIDWPGLQDLRCVNQIPLGQKKVASINF